MMFASGVIMRASTLTAQREISIGMDVHSEHCYGVTFGVQHHFACDFHSIIDRRLHEGDDSHALANAQLAIGHENGLSFYGSYNKNIVISGQLRKKICIPGAFSAAVNIMHTSTIAVTTLASISSGDRWSKRLHSAANRRINHNAYVFRAYQ